MGFTDGMVAGRPPIPPEDVAAWQELYLELLAQGKTEAEVSSVEGMPSWTVRWKWQSDTEFKTNRSMAQAHGASLGLVDARKKLEHTYQRALDDAASPQLVAITYKIAQHARWLASRLAKDDFSETTKTENKNEHSGPNGGPIVMVAKAEDKELLDKV